MKRAGWLAVLLSCVGACNATTGVADGGAGGISVSVQPAASHVLPSGTLMLTATVSGTADPAVMWAVQEGLVGGTVTASGSYTAPSAAGTYHVVASSHADSAATAVATVFVAAAGDCSALPAVGTWENVSPLSGKTATFSQNFSEAIVVDPFDPATVWLTIGYGGIFKSTNCGALGSWVHVNTGRNGAAMDKGSHVSIAIDPVDQGTMYAISIFDTWGFWKSTNGGVDWDQLMEPNSEVTKVTNNFFDSVSMDPTDHHHLILGLHSTCAAPHAKICQAETTDGGASWRIVDVSTPETNWEEGAGPWILDANSWLYGGGHLWLTTNRGADWTEIDPDPAQFYSFSGGEVQTRSIARGSDGAYYLTCGQGIVQSRDGGRSWSLLPGFHNRTVGLVIVGGNLFASDEWSTGYYTASENDLTHWTTIAPPAGLPSDQGAPYVDYDAAHHVLYSSNFAGGTWRLRMP